MLKQRQQQIIAWADQVGAGTYQELAQFLGVSTMTIRREVDELSTKGLIIKTLGGIQRADAPAYLLESAIHGRMGQNRRQKQAIAETAIALADGAEALFIDGSTTCLELAKVMARRQRGVSIVTNSALAALELGRSRNNKVVGLGGEFDPASCCFVGSVAEDEAKRYYVDIAFISTMGFLPGEGTFESTVANFHVKQVFARRAKKVVLLVDSSKIGQRALAKVLDTREIDVVVTDTAAKDDDLKQLTDLGLEVLRATPDREGQNAA